MISHFTDLLNYEALVEAHFLTSQSPASESQDERGDRDELYMDQS